MTSTELADVEALLERVLPDPMGFADRVIGQLRDRMAGDGPAHGVVPAQDASAHQDLVDRQLLLAAALGACECWGQDPGCPTCHGAGASGWTDPDPDLFADYVMPVLSRRAEHHDQYYDPHHDKQEHPAEGTDS